MDNIMNIYVLSPPRPLVKSEILRLNGHDKKKLRSFPHDHNEELPADIISRDELNVESLEDRYILHETRSNGLSNSSSASSRSSIGTTFCMLKRAVEDSKKKHIMENKWGAYALDVLLWEDSKAPVVKLRTLDQIAYESTEDFSFLCERLIAAGSTFLTKSPENGLYILSKCVLRKMSLTNITLLGCRRYLQYIDLAYNEISDLTPLGDIPYLMYLNVSHNWIKYVLRFKPPWFLTYANLSHNYISEICDLNLFWSIVRLDLSHNTIETINGLQNLKFLQYLNLSYNLIECIENLDYLNIQELNLENNCIASFKPFVPGNGLNVLPNLHTVLLGYNRLSSLDFIREAFGLRFLDLKFNKISDLLEVANLKGLVYEIDLRGNPCTKWPNYRDVIVFSMPSAVFIDGAEVSVPEKVSAGTLFASSLDMLAARTLTKLTLLEQLNIPTIGEHVCPFDESSPPLIILTGPSAVKKSALATNVARTLPKRIRYCQWHTTKQKGESAEDHGTYIFIEREEFNEMARRGDFLAIQELLGSSYGFHVDQIVSLMHEKKIGITHTDLHATMQMRKRYPNVKSILVLTKDENVHRDWVKEKFDVYTWCKDSIENLLGVKIGKSMDEDGSDSESSKLNFIGEIIEEVINHLELPTYSMFVRPQGTGATATNIILQSHTLLPKMHKTQTELDSEEKKHITFFGEYDSSSRNILLEERQKQMELKVILDERSNIIVEDEEAKRKRKREKILHRRSGLEIHSASPHHLDELDESSSSDDSLDTVHQPSTEMLQPEYLKETYTELVLKTRKLYSNHHINHPGFFCLVLFNDDFAYARKLLIEVIHELYVNQSLQKPICTPEMSYFSDVSTSTHVEAILNEIRENLLVPSSRHKTLLMSPGITSWKDIMPSQLNKHATEFVTHVQDELRRDACPAP